MNKRTVVFAWILSLLLEGVAVCSDKLDWKLEDAYRVSTETRGKICLNGIWRVGLKTVIEFDKQADSVAPKKDAMKGAKMFNMRVPGKWYDDPYYNMTNCECMVPISKVPEYKIHICSEAKWDGKPLQDYFYAVCEREFKMPKEWKTEESFLRFEQINVEGWIYVNSKLMAYQKGLEARDIPLPADTKPGQNVKLKVIVGAYVTGTEESISTPEVTVQRQRSSQCRGIVGDIWLVKHPKEKVIRDIFVTTSARKKQINVRVEFPEDKPSGTLNINIAPVKTGIVSRKYIIGVNHGKDMGSGIYEYSMSWDDPVLWNPDNPYLYNFNLAWYDSNNTLIDSCLPVRFGFREIWIEGRKYMFNAQPYCLKIRTAAPLPNEEAAEYFYRDCKEANYNCIEMQCGGDNFMDIDASLRKADEMGMLVLVILPNVAPARYEWDKKEVRDGYRKELTMFVKKMRNHPSIVTWSMNFNMLGYSFDMNPFKIGTDYLPPDNVLGFAAKRAVWKDSEAMLDELDGSRPKLEHAGGNHGQISTSNIYLNFPPPQEKEEWLSLFSKNAVKPFIAIELGPPAELSYFHGRAEHGVVFGTEPLYAEYVAMFLGPGAYSMEPYKRMKPVIDSPVIRKAIEGGSDNYTDMLRYYYSVSENEGRPFEYYLRCQAFLGEFMKYWRTWGISGMDPYESVDRRLNYNYKPADSVAAYDSFKTPGIKTMLRYKPYYSARTILFEKYREWFDPELFYIGGGGREEFTDKKHAYRSKEAITKAIVWINERFEPKTEMVKVELKDAGNKVIEQKEMELHAKPGGIQFFEFSFIAPEVTQKTPYIICFSRNINAQYAQKDKFDVQVFPERAPVPMKTARALWLIDKKGLTRKTLQDLKVAFKDYEGGKLGKDDLIVIGRESISELYSRLPGIKDLISRGLNVLVFEQTKADLEKYCKFYAFEASGRLVFLSPQPHSVNNGISQEDMANWTGKGTLLEEYPIPTKDENPAHMWKFGNRGIVSSVVIEKPYKGSCIPIMHQGFDLAYTPLMEEEIGKGMILYCQLDVTGRTQDSPVIEQVTNNIIDYADKRTNVRESKVVYAGAVHGREILDLTGVNYDLARDFDNVPGAAIIVFGDKGLKNNPDKGADNFLGEDSLKNLIIKNKQQLAGHLAKGGTILLLAVNNPAELAGVLGVNLTEYKMEGYWFDLKDKGVLTRGMSAGDFYWKDNFELPLPEQQYPVYSQKDGEGQLVICQIDPLYYSDKDINQRRYRGRFKMNRQLSVIFTNLGASFKGYSTQYLDGVETQDIDLAGNWNFKIDLDNKGENEGWFKETWKSGFKNMKVPGTWEAQDERTPNPNVDGKEPYDGYAWYQRSVVIPSSFKGIPLFLEMGSVDDMDWTYFNGQLIGKTGKETKNYWDAKRYYQLPENLIAYNKPNTITVRVFDEYQEGGLIKGPDRITFKKEEPFFYLPSDDYGKAKFDPYLFYRW